MLGNGVFHGMYNPSVVWANDSRILFDGVNDFFEVVGQGSGSFHDIVGNDFVNAFSVSFWFQHNGSVSLSNEQTFFRIQIGSRGSDIVAKYIPGGTSGVYFTRADQENPSTIDLTGFIGLSHLNFQTYNHYVLTMTKDTITMYLNGSNMIVDPGSSTGGDDWASNDPLDYTLKFGALGAVKFLNGHMNNIAIYNRVLTSTEVTDIYNNGEPKNELRHPGGDPVVYYATNEKNFTTETSHVTMSDHVAALTGATIVPNV
jgi:hypothetical protein